MTILTPEQTDALVEVLNIGSSKAAKLLSRLMNATIEVSIPTIKYIDLAENDRQAITSLGADMSYVYQQLTGDVNGCAIFVYSDEQAQFLVKPILDKVKHFADKQVCSIEKEAMLEIGNILISTVMSGIMNMLNTTVKIGVPLYGKSSDDLIVDHLRKRSAAENQGMSKVFVFQAILQTRMNENCQPLHILLSMESIESILLAVNKLLGY
jgi:chemotaxis protein CheC